MAVSNIREQLVRDEGERLRAYKDTEGLWTIGVGRCIDRVLFTSEEARLCGCEGLEDYSGLEITSEAAAVLLDNDIWRAERQLLTALPWVAELDPARQGVLVNMTFNLGIGGLLAFRRFLRAMQEGNWLAAGIHMLDSKWASQVGDRALRLRRQVETGQWV